MKKYILLIILILLIPTFAIAATTVFSSRQLAPSPVNLKFLQTDGAASAWTDVKTVVTLDSAYDVDDTVDYSSGNGPIHFDFPIGGTTETWNTTFEVTNLWQQMLEDSSGNIINLQAWQASEAGDLPQYYVMQARSEDDGSTWTIDNAFLVGSPALLNMGLIVNDDSNSSADLRVETDNEDEALLVDASADLIDVNVPEVYEDYVAYEVVGLVLSNGANDNINIQNATLIRITGPTAAYSITGITGGTNGRRLIILGTVSFNMTLTNEDGDSDAANRIITGTGGGVTIISVGVIHLIYDSVDSRWRVAGHRG